jgi:hypothetical protein
MVICKHQFGLKQIENNFTIEFARKVLVGPMPLAPLSSNLIFNSVE